MHAEEKIVKWESQVRKGMLDYIILLCLSKKEFYGYELIRSIKKKTGLEVSEGTIYPLLNRLRKDEFVQAYWQEMESGIPRKYYSVTAQGNDLLKGMQQAWIDFNQTISHLMEE